MPGAWETHMWVKDTSTDEWIPYTGAAGGGAGDSNVYINALDQSGNISPAAGCRGATQFSNLATKLQVAITDDNHNPLGQGTRPLTTRESVQLNYDYRAEPTGSVANSAVLIVDTATHASYTYLINNGSGILMLGSLVISNTSQTDAWLKLYANITGAKEIARFFCPKQDTRIYSGNNPIVFAYQGEDLVVAAESNVDSLYISCHIRYIG